MNCKRPDIMFAIAHLSRFVEKPTLRAWGAAKRIYLKGTSELSLI